MPSVTRRRAALASLRGTIPRFATFAAAPYMWMISASPKERCISRLAARRSHAAGSTTSISKRCAPRPVSFAVLTAADIPGRNDASPVNAGDDPILATDSVEFHHQAVFVVVAETRDAARRAAKLGKIEIEAERPLVSVDDALAAESYILPDYMFLSGEPDAALAASPRRVNGSLRIGGQEHFYLEGQVALAVPGEETTCWSTPRPNIQASSRPSSRTCSTCRPRL